MTRVSLLIWALATAPLTIVAVLAFLLLEHNVPISLLVALAASTMSVGALAVWIARLDASHQSLQELYEGARLEALRDPLTGLGNHRAFHEEFRRQLETAARYQTSLALLLIDLDEFKAVNDGAGHAAGDARLIEMRRLMSGTLRRADLAFRVGGDEFAILMPHTDAAQAQVVARRLLAAALEPRPTSPVPASFSFSGGIAAHPEHGTEQRRLHAEADAALYWAKAHGRTLIETFDPERHHSLSLTASRAEVSASIGTLIAGRALTPVFQPIVDLRSGRIIGYEALIRPGRETGFTDAMSMFTAAESCGRETDLDQACLEAIAARAAALAPDMTLTVNLSPRTFEAPEFGVRQLISLFAPAGIGPERIILELTERQPIADYAALQRAVSACQAAGFRVAADDVGAGNAGLRLLSQVHFDVVKIDLSLVHGSTRRQSSLAVLRSLEDLARRSDAWLVAEGIELPEQLRLARDLDIAAAQGYLLGPPGHSLEVGAVDLPALIARDDWLRRLGQAGSRPLPLSMGGATAPADERPAPARAS